MGAFDINSVRWSEPRIVGTKRGRRRIRTWLVPENSPFWRAWQTGTLREQGYTLSKWQGRWQVTEWRLPTGEQEEQARSATAAAAQSERFAQSLDATEPELPPHLQARWQEIERIYAEIHAETGKDFRFQLPSIKRLAVAVEAFDGGLDASDTGTGKTAVACALARLLRRDLFVVCPRNVIPPWEAMAKRFGVTIWAVNYELLRTGRTEFGHWEVAGPKSKAKKFVYDGLAHARKLFVFDECHRLKDWRTLNCALGIGALDLGYKVLALSATAADNPMHMKFVALLTNLIRNPYHFYGWMTQNGVKKGRYGLQFVGGRDVISRIHRQIFPLHGTRIRMADLGDLLPHTQVISEAYAMENAAEINAVYREMRTEIAKLERTRASDGAAAANILVQQLRARQRVELLKVPTILQMANDGLEEGMSVVVVLNFSDTITAFARRWRTLNIFEGDTPDDQRQSLIERFNSDEEDKLVMNIKAGGIGIGLHGSSDGRTRLALLSPTFSGIDIKQAVGRFPRAGGAPSIVKIVWAAGTVEERACDKVRARLQRVSIFNDGIPDDDLAI